MQEVCQDIKNINGKISNSNDGAFKADKYKGK